MTVTVVLRVTIALTVAGLTAPRIAVCVANATGFAVTVRVEVKVASEQTPEAATTPFKHVKALYGEA